MITYDYLGGIHASEMGHLCRAVMVVRLRAPITPPCAVFLLQRVHTIIDDQCDMMIS